MPHIVIVTSGIASLYNSAFGLAHQLLADGHRVTFASPAPLQAAAQAQGLPFVQLDATIPHTHTAAARTLMAKLIGWLGKPLTIGARRQSALDALGTQDFEAHMARLAPDLCIIDIELSAYIISACARNIPTASLAAFLSLRKYDGVPPLHLGIVPGVGWQGSRWGIEWAWLRYRLWKWLHFQTQRIRAVGADPISVLSQHARQVGFPFEREVARYQWLLPFIFRRLPLLYTNAYEIEFPHQPHPSSHYLGPMLLLDRDDMHVSPVQGEVNAALDRFLAERAENPQRRLIYCAFGAAFKGDDSAFLHKVVHALRDETGWDVILALGGRRDPRDLGDLPPHIRAFGWVPQLRVLEHADCAVIHGGIGSMNECVHFGVPMLVYPFKNTNDQLGAAARITYHRLGVVGDRDTDTPLQLRDHIRTLLSDDGYRQRIDAMNNHYQRYREERRAVRIVNALLQEAQQGTFPLMKSSEVQR